MAKMARKGMIPLESVVVDFKRNFAREPQESTYDDAQLRFDLAERGQITSAKLLKEGDTYYPIQGNRRTYNMKKLMEQGVEDPRTCKVDDNGRRIPGTGKPFSAIEAEVYEGLSQREVIELMADYNNTRGLNRVELQLLIEGLFNAGYNEREVCRLAGSLLTQHYPPKRDIKPIDSDNGQDFLNNYRGVIQTAKNRWRSPTKLHDLAMKVLSGKQKWPTNAELKEGLDVYDKEADSDKTGKIDLETPGPVFNAWLDKLVTAHTPVDGVETPGKAISMMNRTQVQDTAKVCNSRMGKFFMYVVLRDPRVKADQLPLVNKLAKKAESGEAWTDEDKAAFDACWNSEEAPTTEPPASE